MNKLTNLRFFVACVAVTLAACDAASLQPLLLPADHVEVPGAVGSWKSKDDDAPSLSIRALEDGLLRATVDGVPFDVRVGRVGKHTWVDAQVAGEGDAVKPLLDWVIRPHLCARAQLDGDTLTLWMVDGDWLQDALKKKTLKLAHQPIQEPGSTASKPRSRVVITAPTEDLKKAVARFQDTPGVFRKDPVVFTRVK